MIGYLEGKLLKKDDDRILLLSNQVGYEVLLPAFVMENLKTTSPGDQLSLFIYYHQTERQPKPVLIGFNLESEKEFFQHFISVEAIGPIKAAKALTLSVSEIAGAIQAKDVFKLKQLKGIGARTAQKIIASLEGKVGKFSLINLKDAKENYVDNKITDRVLTVLIDQLGYKTAEGRQMIADALKKKPDASTPEELFEEIYKGADSQ